MSQELATTESTELDLHRSKDTSEFVSFYVGPQMFGIPINMVQDILTTDRIAPIPLAPSSVHGSINLRGRIVTVFDVHSCLGLPPLDVRAEDVSLMKEVREAGTKISDESMKTVKATFTQIEGDLDEASGKFFTRLSEIRPGICELFKIDAKHRKDLFKSTLKAAVEGAGKLATMTSALKNIGEQHKTLGATNADYDAVREALNWTLNSLLGKDFNPKVNHAWSEVFDTFIGEISGSTDAGDSSSTSPVTYTGVTVEKDHELYTLLVDRIGDVMVVSDKSYESNPGTLDVRWREYALGLYRLEKDLLVVLDVDRLLEQGNEK